MYGPSSQVADTLCFRLECCACIWVWSVTYRLYSMHIMPISTKALKDTHVWKDNKMLMASTTSPPNMD